MKPLNVLHIMTKLPVGGVENQLLTVLGKYDKSRFSPIVCSLADKGEIGKEIENLGIEVFPLHKLKHRFDYTIVKDICRLVREKKVTVVRTHQYHANLYGRLAARSARVPCIVASVHNVYTRDKKIHRRMINRYLARFTDKVIAVSGAVKKDIMKYDGLGDEKIDVICNGVDIKRYSSSDRNEVRSKLDIDQDVPVIGTVGRLTFQKGQKYLLESVSKLKNKFPGLLLLIVGDGPLRDELEHHAETLGIRDSVQFLGVRRDVPELMSAMDIFVLPSLWEGLANALVEAMAAGKPVIATDIPQIGEVINSGNVGILVPAKKSDAIAQSIELLLSDNSLAKKYGDAAYERVALAFSIDVTLKKYTELYETILGRKEWNI